MSKKNAGLLLVVTLILVIAVFAVMYTTTAYAGTLPWSFDSQFVAHCVGTTGGTCGTG